MLNLKAMTNYLKKEYIDNPDRDSLFTGIDPLLDRLLMSKLSGRKTGSSLEVPIGVGRSRNSATTFAEARKNARTERTAVKKAVYSIDLSKTNIYEIGLVENKAIFATKDGQGAFVGAVESETNDVMGALRTKLSGDLYGDGSGSIGQIKSLDATKKIITLKSREPLWYLEVGQLLDFYSAKDATGVRRGNAKNEVIKIDREGLKITMKDALNANAAADDYIFYAGDGKQNVGVSTILGLPAWLPKTVVANDNFYGINRSIDTRLKGFYVEAANNGTVYDTIRKAVVKMSGPWRNAKKEKDANIPRDVYLGSATWEVLADEFDDTMEMRRVNSVDLQKGLKGFTALQILAGGVMLNVWSCPALPPYRGYILHPEKWGLNWYGGGLKNPIDFHTMANGTYFKDAHDGPDIEFRIQVHPVLRCNAVGMQCQLAFDNISSDIDAYL